MRTVDELIEKLQEAARHEQETKEHPPYYWELLDAASRLARLQYFLDRTRFSLRVWRGEYENGALEFVAGLQNDPAMEEKIEADKYLIEITGRVLECPKYSSDGELECWHIRRKMREEAHQGTDA